MALANAIAVEINRSWATAFWCRFSPRLVQRSEHPCGFRRPERFVDSPISLPKSSRSCLVGRWEGRASQLSVGHTCRWSACDRRGRKLRAASGARSELGVRLVWVVRSSRPHRRQRRLSLVDQILGWMAAPICRHQPHHCTVSAPARGRAI